LLTLAAASTLAGVAGSATAITATVYGDEVSAGADAFKKLYQAQLPAVAATLYTVPGSTQSLIKCISLVNTTAGNVTATLYVDGTAAANRIANFTIAAGGFATYDADGWKLYDSTGAQQFVGSTGPTGSTGAAGTNGWSPVLAAVSNGSGGYVLQITSWTGGTGTPPSSTNQFIGASGIVGTAAAAQDIRGPAGAPGASTLAFGIVTGNTGTATADASPDTIAITGAGAISTAATDTPDGLVISSAAATFSATGDMLAREKISGNSQDGRDSTGATPRVFRPGDYMVGNTYDPTGAADSTTSFQACLTAFNAFNDRAIIELAPGVFKVSPTVLRGFGGAPGGVQGKGRAVTVLVPTSAPAAESGFVVLGPTDGFYLRDFAIYNTSGTAYTTGAGILTNNCDSVVIEDMFFVDLYRDVQVSGEPHTATLNGTTAITSVSPALVAGDVTKPVSGPGIAPGTTLSAQAGSSGTLSGAATASATSVIFLGNTIKCSIQRTLHSHTNNSANTSAGVYVNNGLAGDTYIGPDVVMSSGGSARRQNCVALIESGHYEVLQANLTGAQNGITMLPGTSQIVAFGFHSNVLCDSSLTSGMTMNATAACFIKNIKSVNSWYSGTAAAGPGVITTGSAGTLNGVTFSCDRFLNNGTHGFQHGYGTDFRFSDCDMKGNSSAGSGLSDGLNVAANIGNWSINGGKYGGTDTLPTAGNQRYGINVAAGTGNNIKISPDDLTGNVTGPLSMGATGASVFINGCPGLAPGYFRTASSAAITTVITIANTLLPKNSLRPGSAFRLKANFIAAAAITSGTFTVRCGTTNDAVGSAATNAIVVSAVSATGAANAWGWVEFIVTVTAVGAAGNIQGNGVGQLSTTAASAVTAGFGTAANARASGAGFLAVDTTSDKYLTLAVAAAASNVTVHNSQIEIVSY
jgi:collagen type VII alpha